MTHPDSPRPSGDDPSGAPAWGQESPPYGGQPSYGGLSPQGGFPGQGGYAGPPGAGFPPGSGQPPYGQPYGGYGYPPPRATSGMAIASMVLGILWLYWIGSILALVFGYIAKRQIRERGESGAGMATAGIVLGWIGIGFLVLFIVLGIAASSSSDF